MCESCVVLWRFEMLANHPVAGTLGLLLLASFLLAFLFLAVWVGSRIQYGGNCRNCEFHNECPNELQARCPEGRLWRSRRVTANAMPQLITQEQIEATRE